tara:strand:- start:703 stop:1320 length:618 start_codon:yes stop_codon:yes gene_type:complete
MIKIILLILLNSVICESLIYDVHFKKIKVGSATLNSQKINNNSNKIIFSVKTKKFIDFIYKIRENISMIARSNNYSLQYIKKKSQHKNTYIEYENNISVSEQLYDPISIIFFLRNQELFIDDKFTFNIFKPNKNKKIGMSVVGEETIYAMKDNYECFILAPFNINNEKGKIKLWISKKTKLPVIIEQDGKYGKIIMKLKSITNAN